MCTVLRSLKRGLNQTFILVRNAYIIILVFSVLNVRDGTEPKYPSIAFLSILFIKCCGYSRMGSSISVHVYTDLQNIM